MTTPLIEARRQLLRINLPAEELWVEGDPDRLAQVVGNLLTNAAKYTDEVGEIWLEGQKERGQAVIHVRDSGMGIAPEVLPRVFELFAQADQSLARSLGGLGIGLTMVQKLVQMHGGTVEAHSEGLGKGSEFIVRLPVLTASREGGTSFDFPDAIANRP
jgi:signal transduction histidine kinase